MDLAPFQRINPCGYAGLEMVDCAILGGPKTLAEASSKLIKYLCTSIGVTQTECREGFND